MTKKLLSTLFHSVTPYPMSGTISGTSNTAHKNSWAAAKPVTNLQPQYHRQAPPSKQIQRWQHAQWTPLHSKYPGICTSTSQVYTIKVKPQQMQFTFLFFLQAIYHLPASYRFSRASQFNWWLLKQTGGLQLWSSILKRNRDRKLMHSFPVSSSFLKPLGFRMKKDEPP